MCMAGLPTGTTLRCSILDLVMMSMPQKVKKTSTSIPIMRPALANTKAGYAISKLPLEQIIDSLRVRSSLMVISPVRNVMRDA